MLLVGTGLLLMVGFDALSTTLSIGAAAGPLTSRLGAGWWRTARRLARAPDSPIIVSAGPVVVLLTICVWLGSLWGGWTLVFAADPDAVISSATRAPASGWSRVYFAGFTAFTLGVGDYVPNGQPWEVLTAVAVVSGLGLTTLAITYLVPVVSAVTARRVQANTIAGMGATPQDIVLTGLRDDRFPFLEHRLQALSDSILETAERHLSYPVLHYFHSAERHVDLRTQALLLDEAVTLLAHGVRDDVRPNPAVLDGTRHAIVQLVERATGEPPDLAPPPSPALGALRQAGVPTVDDDTFARSLADLSDHRRRVAHFASESLWTRMTQITRAATQN
ncbi:MAG: ion channel [Actinomycetes bacterium]